MRNLKFLSASEQDQLKNQFNDVYKRTIEYIDKYYDFENSVFKLFSKFDLKNAIIYEDAIEAVNSLCLKNVDEDRLYDEINKLKQIHPHLKESNAFSTMSVDLLWVQLFKVANFTELSKIVGNILSIPISNAFVERVFSLMGNLWTDERNCLSVKMVKSELIIKVNYKMSCQDFLNYLKKPEQAKMLQQTLANKKYDFKNQAGPSNSSV